MKFFHIYNSEKRIRPYRHQRMHEMLMLSKMLLFLTFYFKVSGLTLHKINVLFFNIANNTYMKYDSVITTILQVQYGGT